MGFNYKTWAESWLATWADSWGAEAAAPPFVPRVEPDYISYVQRGSGIRKKRKHTDAYTLLLLG